MVLVIDWQDFWCINSFSTMTRFRFHSGDYLVILYSFRNLCGD
ncbi:hypothetical protein E2C01_095929 [Portunus trituberculatus]|uniref:Uncharacterized protein n=1 Tax=Portunus trituberculatus TaxID=210409 RepID=A0A5B7K0N2_PORTR|nr:hypothetical protein [Portunus trituberculatus]